MPEETGNAGTGDGTGQQTGTGGGTEQQAKTFTQAEVDALVSARIARERAKYSDYADLQKFKQGAMSDSEKAIAAARLEGEQSVRATMSAEVVKAQFSAKATTAGIAPGTVSGLLGVLDTSRFLKEDGTVDEKLIDATIAGMSPKEKTNFEGGARRTSQAPQTMSDLIRQQAGIGF